MQEIHITLYKANWCGYCQRYDNDWTKIKDALQNNNDVKKELAKNKIKIVMNEYEEGEEKRKVEEANKKGENYESEFDKAGIGSFPTVRVNVIKILNSFDLEGNERFKENFVNSVFSEKKLKITCDRLTELKTVIDTGLNPEKKMNGGFFDYSQNQKNKYYKEYIKCRNLYLKMKNN